MEISMVICKPLSLSFICLPEIINESSSFKVAAKAARFTANMLSLKKLMRYHPQSEVNRE